MSFINLCTALIKREFILAGRQFSNVINPTLFFILVIILFPLTLLPGSKLLPQIAPGVFWTVTLLANLLGLDRLFRVDFEDGMLEQYLLSPYPISLIVVTKIFMHWLMTNFPLIILTPVFSPLFHLEFKTLQILMISLVLGTPVISLIGSVTVALTIKLQSNSLLTALCVLPLMVPIIIFGAGCAVNAALGVAINSQLALLAAILILSLTFLPMLIGVALRVGVE